MDGVSIRQTSSLPLDMTSSQGNSEPHSRWHARDTKDANTASDKLPMRRSLNADCIEETHIAALRNRREYSLQFDSVIKQTGRAFNSGLISSLGRHCSVG